MDKQKQNKKSEKRQRTVSFTVRLLPEEKELLDEKAAHAGLKLAGYVRECCLGSAGKKSQRQSSLDRQALSQLLGELGKIGSNLNQLAKRANTDGFHAVSPEHLKEGISAISDLRAVTLEVLKQTR